MYLKSMLRLDCLLNMISEHDIINMESKHDEENTQISLTFNKDKEILHVHVYII